MLGRAPVATGGSATRRRPPRVSLSESNLSSRRKQYANASSKDLEGLLELAPASTAGATASTACSTIASASSAAMQLPAAGKASVTDATHSLGTGDAGWVSAYVSLLAESSLGGASMQRHLARLVKGAADVTNTARWMQQTLLDDLQTLAVDAVSSEAAKLLVEHVRKDQGSGMASAADKPKDVWRQLFQAVAQDAQPPKAESSGRGASGLQGWGSASPAAAAALGGYAGSSATTSKAHIAGRSSTALTSKHRVTLQRLRSLLLASGPFSKTASDPSRMSFAGREAMDISRRISRDDSYLPNLRATPLAKEVETSKRVISLVLSLVLGAAVSGATSTLPGMIATNFPFSEQVAHAILEEAEVLTADLPKLGFVGLQAPPLSIHDDRQGDVLGGGDAATTASRGMAAPTMARLLCADEIADEASHVNTGMSVVGSVLDAVHASIATEAEEAEVLAVAETIPLALVEAEMWVAAAAAGFATAAAGQEVMRRASNSARQSRDDAATAVAAAATDRCRTSTLQSVAEGSCSQSGWEYMGSKLSLDESDVPPGLNMEAMVLRAAMLKGAASMPCDSGICTPSRVEA